MAYVRVLWLKYVTVASRFFLLHRFNLEKIMRVCPLHVIVNGVIHPVLTWTAINPAHDAKVRAATVHGVNVTQKLFQSQCHKYVAYKATPNHVGSKDVTGKRTVNWSQVGRARLL